MPKRKSTRAAQGSGNIRKRPDGRWEGRYTPGRDSGTGKQIQKSVYGNTQAEVRKKLQQITTAIDEGVFVEPQKMTVGQWLNIWLAEYTADLKPHTLKSYTVHVQNHIKPALGAVKLIALNAHEIQTFYNHLQPELSPKTIKNLHGVLHKALAQAAEPGLAYIKFNPADACKLPRVEKPEIKPLNDEQVAAFIKQIKGHPDENLFIVDLFTGLRQGEILGLSWDCIDFGAGTIYIYRQLQKVKGQYVFVSLKNDKTRRIKPAQTVMRALQEQRRVQMGWRLVAGPAWDNCDNLVFTNELGRYIAHVTIYKRFKRIAANLGIPAARFHDLRHSYAVAALQAGDDPKSVQENLGHYSPAFTLEVYGHITERMKNESAARMESYIQSLSKL